MAKAQRKQLTVLHFSQHLKATRLSSNTIEVKGEQSKAAYY